MNRHDSVLSTIGGTPTIRINKLAPPGIELYVKAEAFNPGGSIKDRLALGVIEDAERKGILKPGQTVIEATSGNTGIGLAVVCAQKGYPLVVTMAESFSVERRRLMRFFGAKVVLTPASLKVSGLLTKAIELAEKHGWFLARQFENEANAEMHMRTTGPEIIEDFADAPLDYWLTGYGTGGTLKGVAAVLRQQSPGTKVIVCEPDNSNLLGSGLMQQRDDQGRPTESHPGFRPHLMQGWTPDFISKLTGDAVDGSMVDEVLPIPGNDALYYARALAQQEGILTGITAGATFAGAMQIAERSPAGTRILCMLPDTGERYLSTPLFDDIPEEMTEAEIELSRSTASARFDSPPPAPAAEEEQEAPEIVPAVADMVEQLIGNTESPVVMFALEWCEFCWSVRKMFAAFNIDYQSIDLDSAAYQQDNLSGNIRAVLQHKTSAKTIPQIFVGGTHVGGATEVFDAYKSGELQTLLQEHGVSFDNKDQDPYGFLPKWLQPR
jgi:cysteine synthase A